jgi:hypothetical protein
MGNREEQEQLRKFRSKNTKFKAGCWYKFRSITFSLTTGLQVCNSLRRHRHFTLSGSPPPFVRSGRADGFGLSSAGDGTARMTKMHACQCVCGAEWGINGPWPARAVEGWLTGWRPTFAGPPSSSEGIFNYLEYFLFFFDFSKIHVSSQILQNYTITGMRYGVWAQTPYHLEL